MTEISTPLTSTYRMPGSVWVRRFRAKQEPRRRCRWSAPQPSAPRQLVQTHETPERRSAQATRHDPPSARRTPAAVDLRHRSAPRAKDTRHATGAAHVLQAQGNEVVDRLRGTEQIHVPTSSVMSARAELLDVLERLIHRSRSVLLYTSRRTCTSDLMRLLRDVPGFARPRAAVRPVRTRSARCALPRETSPPAATVSHTMRRPLRTR